MGSDPASAAPLVLELEHCSIDLARGVVRRAGDEQRLTTKERALLAYLAERPGATVQRDELLREVWGFRGRIPNSRAPDFAMKRLREKVEARPTRPHHLLTVHGEGYRFVGATARSTMSPSSSGPPPARPLQPPGAPYTAEWYAPRVDAERAADALLSVPGAPVVIVGAARVGKTWLLDHLLESRATSDDIVVRVETDQLEPAPGDDGGSALAQLAIEIAGAIPGGDEARERAWAQAGHERRRLTRLLEESVLPAIGGRLFLALDGADRWSERGDPSGFFGMLRSWASQRRGAWDRLRLLLTISTEPALLVEDARLSPFNLAPAVRISGLSRDSLDALAVGTLVDGATLDALHRSTGGHAELIRRALHAIAVGTCTAARLEDDEALIDEPFGPFLRSRLAAISLHPALGAAVRQVLEGAAPADFLVAQRLVSAGILARSSGEPELAYPLLERFLRRHFR